MDKFTTTITFKDGIIAADTQITWGSVPGLSHKIRIIGDVVIAFAGDVKQEGVINEYFKGERKELPKFKRGTSFELLVVENKSVYWCQNNLFLQLMENSYYAIGNGWECAMAAMQCGKSAAEAVIVASKLNVYTNDIIDTYNIKTKKLTLSPFPK